MEGAVRIGEVAKRTGFMAATIRYYEKLGLIRAAQRSDALYPSPGYRLFTEEDVRRLEFIKRARLLDLSLAQIREIIQSAEEGCCTSARPSLRAIIAEKLPQVEEKIEMLRTLQGELQRIRQSLAEIPEVGPAVCDCPAEADVVFCVFGDDMK